MSQKCEKLSIIFLCLCWTFLAVLGCQKTPDDTAESDLASEESTTVVTEDGAEISLSNGTKAKIAPGTLDVDVTLSMELSEIPEGFEDASLEVASLAYSIKAVTGDGKKLEYTPKPFSLEIAIGLGEKENENSEAALAENKYPSNCIIGRSKSLERLEALESQGALTVKTSGEKTFYVLKTKILGTYFAANCLSERSGQTFPIDKDGRIPVIDPLKAKISLENAQLARGESTNVQVETLSYDNDAFYDADTTIALFSEPESATTLGEVTDLENAKYSVELKAKESGATEITASINETNGPTTTLTITDADDATACSNSGGYYYSAACNDGPITCDSASGKTASSDTTCRDMTVSEATTESACTAISAYWYNSTCNANQPPALILFGLTGQTINYNNLTTANAACEAGKGGLTCTAKAFLGFSAAEEIRDMPSMYGFSTVAPIHSTNDTKIADNWTDLMDGTIDSSLNDAGVATSSYATGSLSDGALDGSNNCTGFTDYNSTVKVQAGDHTSTTSTWLQNGTAGAPACFTGQTILCLCY